MNCELIMKSDVLDIIFEKRNKDYGAYRLRKCYNTRLIKSIGIMISGVIVCSAFTFLPEPATGDTFIIEDIVFGQVLPSSKVEEIKPPLIKPARSKSLTTVKLTSEIVIVNNKDSVDILHNLDNRAIGSTNRLNEAGTQLAGASGVGTTDYIEPPKQEPLMVDITTPMDIAEIMPQFPGGMQALRKFLVRNLNNPRDLEKGELISVKVKFVVGYDGKLQRFEFLEGGGKAFNNEVIRVLKKMPAWTPGKSKGQNVSVFYIIPVKFIAED